MSIPNLISGIRNACIAKKSKTLLDSSRPVFNLLKILKKANYIGGYSKYNYKKVNIYIYYPLKKNAILSLKGLIRPSSRIFYSTQDLWKFDKSLGLLILSTSKGMISHKEALSEGIGGEVLFYIQ